jgi:endonuclease/exonuclease/phosphatase family metal-dependent hydrolase
MERLLFALACAAFGAAMGACASNPTSGAAARVASDAVHLRVVSYNIAAGEGGLDGVAETIRALDADIVALQEVDVRWSPRSAFEDQAGRLATLLGMQLHFAPIYWLPPEQHGMPPRRYGLALLSPHPIRAAVNHTLTRLSTQQPDPVPEPLPGFPEALVDLGAATVRVFNTHLDYRADPRVRSMQVADMLDVIGPLSRPVILAGDLNARPDATELAPLFEFLQDAWNAGQGPGFTFPAHAPDRRIDYILVSPHFHVRRAFVVESSASAHLPVVADLVLRAGGR